MTEQLKDIWQSKFGNEYTDRNVFDYKTRFEAWKEMLDGLNINGVLEIGCNRGYNLMAIEEILAPKLVQSSYDDGYYFFGVEPNQYAREQAQKECRYHTLIEEGNCFDLDYVDNSVDLVFTSNVLIHIALKDLHKAMKEIIRVSKKYILCIEYFDEKETKIHYRGHDNALWKRDFKKHYLEVCPELKIVKEGFWDMKNGFDDSHWVLFEK